MNGKTVATSIHDDQAIMTLEEILKIDEPAMIERDAATQRFVAQWKCVKQFLRDSERGYRLTFAVAARIFNEEETAQALEMVDDRNLSSYT